MSKNVIITTSQNCLQEGEEYWSGHTCVNSNFDEKVVGLLPPTAR